MRHFTRSDRVLLHKEPAFELTYDITYLDDGREMYLVHLDVHKFNKSILHHLHDVVDCLRPTLPPIIFCQPANDSPLFEKFVGRFGFKFISDCWCEDGKNRRFFVHYRR